jgi:Ni/Co efflux regulator RcnB
MKSTAIVLAIAMSLGFGSLALAQGNGRRGPNDEFPRTQQQAPRQTDMRGQPRHENRVEQRTVQRTERRDDRWQNQRPDQRFDPSPGQRLDQREGRWNDRRAYYNARGPEFRRGGYIPREYRNPVYYINDYRPYHLPPPPRNHQWVQVGADYVLIAIATGIIASIVLSQ